MDRVEIKTIDEQFSAYVDELLGLVVDVLDESTGEMVPTPIGQLPPERVLVGLGYAVKSHLKDQALQLATLDEQMAILKQQQQRVQETTERQVDFLKSRAAMILTQLNQADRVPRNKQGRPYFKIAGCGKWSVQTIGRDKVDTTAFDELDEDRQQAIRQVFSDLFRTKTTVAPDLKAIQEQLKAGSTVTGFTLIKAEPGIAFKFETGTGIADDAGAVASEDKN